MALIRVNKSGIPLYIPEGDYLTLWNTRGTFPYSTSTGSRSHTLIGHVKGYTRLTTVASATFQSVMGIKADGSITLLQSGANTSGNLDLDISDYDYITVTAVKSEAFNYTVAVATT